MNEKRFIELLNLYIDGEIAPDEQQELENEVAGNCRRRQTYQSYCRLQQASQQVYRQFGQALTQTVDLKKYHIVARSSTRCCLRRGLLYSSGALAAACLTVVAAFAVFQDSQRPPFARADAEENFGRVEVFHSSALNSRQVERKSSTSFNRPEGFTFAGRSGSFNSGQRETRFLESDQSSFEGSTTRRQTWGKDLQPNARPRDFRGESSFDTPSEVASFKFQR